MRRLNTRACRARQWAPQALLWVLGASRAIKCQALYLWDLSCADDQNSKIVRCPFTQGRSYHDFWSSTKNPLIFYYFSKGIYGVSGSSDPISKCFFYSVAKGARKSRSRRIRTEQKSTMGMRPLDESAPSAR